MNSLTNIIIFCQTLRNREEEETSRERARASGQHNPPPTPLYRFPHQAWILIRAREI